jgi:hypothetical protein
MPWAGGKPSEILHLSCVFYMEPEVDKSLLSPQSVSTCSGLNLNMTVGLSGAVKIFPKQNTVARASPQAC